MKRYVLAYVGSGLVFFALDYLWLRYMGQSFYRERLGDLLAAEFNLTVAGLFYAAYLVGVVIFAIQPAVAAGSWTTALLYGALFGFFAYGTYDMTNLATLRNWPLSVALVDIAWGTVLTGTAAAAGYEISARLAGGR